MIKKMCVLLSIVIVVNMAAIGCGKKMEVPDSSMASEEEVKDVVSRIRMEDDYYNYVNKELLSEMKIPGDEAGWSYFYSLGNEVYENLNTTLLELVEKKYEYGQDSSERKMADLYLTALDMDKRNLAGLGELSGYLDKISLANSIQEYLEVTAEMGKVLGNGSLISFSEDVDMKNSSGYVYYVNSPDLVIGKEYLENDECEDVWQAYRNYITKVLILTGDTEEDARQKSSDIFDFQKEMAGFNMSAEDKGDPSKIYHVYSEEDLSKLFFNVDIKPILKGWGADRRDQYIVGDEEAEKKVNDYLKEENLVLLKDYSKFILVNDYAKYLNEDIRNSYLAFRQYQLGSADISSNEKLASKITQDLASFEFGRLYVEQYFSQENKTAVEQMARDILAVYEIKIDGLEWMGDATKAAAKRKLHTMDLKIGYPDTWPDYLGQADINAPEDGGSLIDNVLALTAARQMYDREKRSEPVDRSVWMMPPQTVNAYYNPSVNEIVFPAAILQPPFYDKDADYAENLGGIGMVIAHEITHAFDNNGAQFDEKGNYNGWWTKADYDNFNRLTQAVTEYYNKQEAFDGHMVNGTLTLGENIADLGALSCITQLAGDKKTDLQQLYRRYAQIWASKYTEQNMLNRLNNDPHSPAKVRVNAVLGSTDAFYDVYRIKEGDTMYVKPDKRVKVW